jgi:hypothetical protein
MGGSEKETVVIVHGTWAAPEPGTSCWYRPVVGAQSFTAKLDAMLQERGSPARCWAHCSQGDEIFQWSGANNWVDRTHAAFALGNYITKLQNNGWKCHIVAHSHGGNIVAEAMSQLMTTRHAKTLLGKIVTLGTPFLDITSPILKQIKRRTAILNIISWVSALLFIPIVLMLAIVSSFYTGHKNIC